MPPIDRTAGHAALGDSEFFITGRLDDGTPVSAMLHRGTLVCDNALRERAEILVKLDDLFRSETVRSMADPAWSPPASLDGPPATIAMTLIRAMSQVHLTHFQP